MKFVINPKFIPAVKNRSQQALKKAWLYMETMLKKAVPKDNGDLQKSIFYELISEKTVRVWSISWSAYVAEKGREPWKLYYKQQRIVSKSWKVFVRNMPMYKKIPPAAALIGWLSRKKGVSGKKTQDLSSQPKSMQAAAYALARKIGRDGIEAKHIFSKTREANKDKAKKIYFDTLKR